MAGVNELMRMELGYNAWANQRLLAACAQLTAEERARDLACSHRSVLRTLQHMYDAELFWGQCLEADAVPPIEDFGPTEVPEVDFETMERGWPAVRQRLEDWFEGLREGELENTVITSLRGRELRFTRWELLRHMVNHASLHRGQVSGMLRILGKEPPNLDLFSYSINLQMEANKPASSRS